jgi:hypothetical protein
MLPILVCPLKAGLYFAFGFLVSTGGFLLVSIPVPVFDAALLLVHPELYIKTMMADKKIKFFACMNFYFGVVKVINNPSNLIVQNNYYADLAVVVM